jgi:hypothetical protein
MRQTSAKESNSSKKRDVKKAAPLKGSTQPTGKNSTFKGDGRSGEFKNDTSEEE